MEVSFVTFMTLISAAFANGLPKFNPTATFRLYSVGDIIFKKLTLEASSVLAVEATNASVDASFILFAAHSQKFNITLSYFETSTPPAKSVTGNDIGLVTEMADGQKQATVWLFNRNSKEITVLVSIIQHMANDPIPGGCNMEFPVEVSPYIRLHNSQAQTYLDFQHARGHFPSRYVTCDLSITYMKYEVYVYFLPENDFTEEEYYQGLQMMSSTSAIRQHGIKVSHLNANPTTRHRFMSYPGKGTIYAVTAEFRTANTTYTSAYVPGASYNCQWDSKVDGCGQLTGTFGKVFCIVLALVGLVICFRGHRLFSAQMFYFGFLSFALIAFILLTRYTGMTSTDRDVLTVSLGVIGGLLWMAVWWFLGIPVISMVLVGFDLGFLLTATVFFTPVGDLEILHNDLNYWLILGCGILIVPIFLIPCTKTLSILATSVMGSYAVVIALDRYLSTTLSYIILNVVKRATFENLTLASNEHPFQANDIILSVAWACLAILGLCIQLVTEHRRAPFPPAPYVTWRRDRELRQQRLALLHERLLTPTAPGPHIYEDEHQPLLFERSYQTTHSYQSMFRATPQGSIIS